VTTRIEGWWTSGLRADFYGQAAGHPELLAALRDRQLLVEPMTPEELRAAIEQPAAAAGLVLDDVLSHVSWATWRRRSGLVDVDNRGQGVWDNRELTTHAATCCW
jgi:hypothetical protein